MLTYENVKATVQKIVLDKPEFVYGQPEDCPTCDEDALCTKHISDSCLYFYFDEDGRSDPSAPACIVGHWMHAEGFGPEDFGVRRWDEIEGRGVNAVLPGLMQEIEPEAVDFLWNLQSLQDTGSTWINSYVTASARVEGRTNV